MEFTYSEEKDDQVRPDECSEDAQISPAVAKVVSKRRVELIANLERAVLAHVRGVIEQVSRSTVGEKVAHVLAAILTYKRRSQL
jgi:hypothetical protein